MSSILINYKSILLSALVASCSLSAATTWTGLSDGFSWEDAGNWSSLAPSSSNGAVFNTVSDTAIINAFTVQSITFGSGAGVNSITFFSGNLTVNGDIINNSSVTQQFDVTIVAASNATWDGPIEYRNIVNVGTSNITLAGVSSFSKILNFDITNDTTFGRFIGTGTTSFTTGSIINIGGSYTGVLGNTFDFTTGNFNNATLGALPTLTDTSLAWNTSQFLSSGILTVVSAIPEPSTYAALAGVLVLGMAATRKRRPSA